MLDSWQRTPIATAPLSAILIVRDAGPELEEVVTTWAAQLDSRQQPYEIILVNDSGVAEMAARTDELATRIPALRICHHAEARGFGAALRTGIEAARHPLLFYTMGDRQYQPADLQRLLDVIDRVDLVTGCRAGRVPPLWWRGLALLYRIGARILFGLSMAASPCWLGRVGRGSRWLARWLFGVRVHDPECAFRLFRRSIFRRIPIQSDGDFAQVEILAKANFLGHLMDETPVAYQWPAAPVKVPAGSRRRFWREVRQLLSAADFGPVTLPPEETPTAVEMGPLQAPPEEPPSGEAKPP